MVTRNFDLTAIQKGDKTTNVAFKIGKSIPCSLACTGLPHNELNLLCLHSPFVIKLFDVELVIFVNVLLQLNKNIQHFLKFIVLMVQISTFKELLKHDHQHHYTIMYSHILLRLVSIRRKLQA